MQTMEVNNKICRIKNAVSIFFSFSESDVEKISKQTTRLHTDDKKHFVLSTSIAKIYRIGLQMSLV